MVSSLITEDTDYEYLTAWSKEDLQYGICHGRTEDQILNDIHQSTCNVVVLSLGKESLSKMLEEENRRDVEAVKRLNEEQAKMIMGYV